MLAEQAGGAELHGVDVASIAASGKSQLSTVQDLSWGFANELLASAASRLSNSRISRYQQHRTTNQPWRNLRRITRHSLKELYGNVADLTQPNSGISGIRRSVIPSLKPQGPGCNDNTLRERVVNVLTALPFLALGHSELRQNLSKERKAYGLSMLAVGTAATAYHCASGPLRKAFRRADYWTICLASNQLARAACPQKMPLSLTAFSLAATPFQPTAVTAVNMAAAEVGLACKAKSQPHLRKAYRHHVLAGATGLACFGLEDMAIQHDFHFVHSMWHCLAFCGLAKASAVLN